MPNKYKTISVRIITVMMLVFLPLLGSDCEDVINQINQDPTGELSGNWTLIWNDGTIRDICPGENVVFPSNSGGTATLTCPGQSPIDRDYTVTGSTLTYTTTGMEYGIGFTQNNELVLSGLNNNRILYYGATITDKSKQNAETVDGSRINNSSEIK